jgi:hypothetical protein
VWFSFPRPSSTKGHAIFSFCAKRDQAAATARNTHLVDISVSPLDATEIKKQSGNSSKAIEWEIEEFVCDSHVLEYQDNEERICMIPGHLNNFFIHGVWAGRSPETSAFAPVYP